MKTMPKYASDKKKKVKMKGISKADYRRTQGKSIDRSLDDLFGKPKK